ncbi:MAG TPA: 8-amino-7-oxononanoate synthase [Thermodesulfovibrionales bacterium]|nr:8-amino-7-oxononanoate synthase [Thermodesulfovibrionales bacterium]
MFREKLEELRLNNLSRTIRDRMSTQGPVIRMDDRELINFASNDYLGLANHPEVRESATNSVDTFGFGGGASRLLGGGTVLHGNLEEQVARFKGTEAALALSSGYSANTGIIPTLAAEGDMLLSDERNHASIIDGCKLSRAETLVYRHRDVHHLEELIVSSPRCAGRRYVVVTDTVFSMDGDVAPLYKLCEICVKHGALLYLDDAHGTGVLGGGKGALAHFDILPEPWIIQMGTFSKAMGSYGAFVAGSREAIDWITNTSRSLIFSTALPSCVAAASSKAIDLVQSTPQLLYRLWDNRNLAFALLKGKGYDTGESETPIIPLKVNHIEDALHLAQRLYEAGIYVPAIRPPTVKEPRLRITVTAAHSKEQIESLVEALPPAF